MLILDTMQDNIDYIFKDELFFANYRNIQLIRKNSIIALKSLNHFMNINNQFLDSVIIGDLEITALEEVSCRQLFNSVEFTVLATSEYKYAYQPETFIKAVEIGDEILDVCEITFNTIETLIAVFRPQNLVEKTLYVLTLYRNTYQKPNIKEDKITIQYAVGK